MKIKPKPSHMVLCMVLHFTVNLCISNGRLDKIYLYTGFFFPGFIKIRVCYVWKMLVCRGINDKLEDWMSWGFVIFIWNVSFGQSWLKEKEGLRQEEISATADWQTAWTFNPSLWIIDWRGDEVQLLFSRQADCLTQSAA